MFQTLRGLSQSLSFTLMSVDIWKVFQTITLTHPSNFALVNIALNQLPEGPDGPDPPDGAGAAGVHLGRGPPIRSSPDGQDEAIDTPTTLVGALVRPLHCYHTAFNNRYMQVSIHGNGSCTS